MALTYTPRLGLPTWGAGTDVFTRAQMNAAHTALDAAAGIDLQVATANDRPPPGSVPRGTYCAAADTGAVSRSDGTTWQAVSGAAIALATGPPGPETFNAPGAPGVAALLARADHIHAMPAHDGPAHAGVSLSALATPTGAISMGGNRILNVATPTGGTDAVTKAYVDAKVAAMKWSTKTPLTLAAGYALATPFSGYSPFGYQTKDDGQQVRISGNYQLKSNNGGSLLPAGLTTIPPAIRSTTSVITVPYCAGMSTTASVDFQWNGTAPAPYSGGYASTAPNAPIPAPGAMAALIQPNGTLQFTSTQPYNDPNNHAYTYYLDFRYTLPA